jgi:Flp pilus assembly pilin Flp
MTTAAAPPSRFEWLRRLPRAEDGIAATEFGLIAPVLFLMLFGAFDISHTLYMKSVLEGAVQKASRDATLQTAAGNDDAARDAIDEAVRDQLTPLNSTATITFNRRFYRSFSDAAAAEAEEFTDSASGIYADGICNNNETFIDINNNGEFDADGGDTINRAGARDNVVYTVAVEYPRLFPLHMFIGIPETTRLEATTVLANQPYGDQDSYDTPTEEHCT